MDHSISSQRKRVREEGGDALELVSESTGLDFVVASYIIYSALRYKKVRM